MAVPVSVFNANTLPVNVIVNNGTQFTIGGAAGPSFTPVLPTSGGPTYDNNPPAPNKLGPGTNSFSATPQGSIVPVVFALPIPTNQQIISLQVYVFWQGSNSVSWVLLNNGQLIAQNTATAALMAISAEK
jgi:hypothetical protein